MMWGSRERLQGRIMKGQEETSRVMDMFITLIVVMVMWVYSFDKSQLLPWYPENKSGAWHVCYTPSETVKSTPLSSTPFSVFKDKLLERLVCTLTPSLPLSPVPWSLSWCQTQGAGLSLSPPCCLWLIDHCLLTEIPCYQSLQDFQLWQFLL